MTDDEGTRMTQTVRTRFAPSPTGYLHVGGARTALFNYLLARRLGGKFALRIEDTDQQRNVSGAADKLLDDLRWLGLHWDEGPQAGGELGPYYQSQRLEIYQQHARRLLEQGDAYYAFDTRDELDAMRAEAQKRKQNFRYPRPASFPSEAQARQAHDASRPVVIRFKMPEQDFVVPDQILGEVRIKAGEVDDFVIQKADGWPTYHFAVVVDDELMGVTHVLRGQEHLMNTPNHMGLQQAFGFRTPVYAHLPIILNMDGSKMSKREKNVAVRQAVKAELDAGGRDAAQLAALAGVPADILETWLGGDATLESEPLSRLAAALRLTLPEIEIHDFRVSGYLPEVLVNFIALLGWSPGGDREKMSLDEMCQTFSLDRIGRTNARFDRAKLLNFNTTALAAAGLPRKRAALKDYLAVNPASPLAGQDDATLERVLELCEGMRVLRDVETKTGPLFMPDDAYAYDADVVQKVLLKSGGAGRQIVAELRELLAAVADWSPAGLEAAVKSYAEPRGLGLGKVAQPLRVAVTGTNVSPAIFDTLALLGRERTLARIDRTLGAYPRG